MVFFDGDMPRRTVDFCKEKTIDGHTPTVRQQILQIRMPINRLTCNILTATFTFRKQFIQSIYKGVASKCRRY